MTGQAKGRTMCVVLTPTARGAVAVVEVRGPKSADAIDATFAAKSGRSIKEQPYGAIRYGRWLSTGEDVVVVRWQDRCEVHAHGGTAAVKAVFNSLIAAGCEAIDAWTAHEGISRITQSAARCLSQATTRRCAEILCDQWQGALEAELREVDAQLISNTNAVTKIQELLRWSQLGEHLIAPWQVVLAGAPNVGKSSLINALLGYERAIVFDQPGTTRDVVTATTALDGWPVLLCDTAGLRDTHDPLEKAGVALARERLATADLVVLVEHAAEAIRDPAMALASIRAWQDLSGPNVRRLVVLSQSDRVDEAKLAAAIRELSAQLATPVIATSATQRIGIDQLATAIATLLVPDTAPAGAAVPFAVGQVVTLRATLALCEAGDLAAARKCLATLLV